MYLMENHMRLLGSVDHTAWITCERCGNTYSGGGQQCSRCGKTPTILQRLGNFSSPSTAKKVSARGVLRRTRSRGAYPGLAETALLSDRASRRRAARIAFACALGAGALIAYALTKPYFAGIGLTPQTEESRLPATGPLVQSGQVVTQGNRVLPAQPSALNGHQNASDETTRTSRSDVSAFYRALQAGNLSVARRRLAEISVNSEGSSQLEQMHCCTTRGIAVRLVTGSALPIMRRKRTRSMPRAGKQNISLAGRRRKPARLTMNKA
jgi:ribosomal protein L37E